MRRLRAAWQLSAVLKSRPVVTQPFLRSFSWELTGNKVDSASSRESARIEFSRTTRSFSTWSPLNACRLRR